MALTFGPGYDPMQMQQWGMPMAAQAPAMPSVSPVTPMPVPGVPLAGAPLDAGMVSQNILNTADPNSFMPQQGGGFGGLIRNPDGSMNYNGLGMIGGALQTVGSMWNAWKANRLASESLNFQKEAYQTNLANETQSYNTALEDRIRSRSAVEGTSQGEANAYLKKHKL